MTNAPPADWSSDVVLADGGSVHVRPIRPSDGAALESFHATLSDESVRRRYFGPKRSLSAAEVEHLTTVDHDARVALIVEQRGRVVAVARYERVPSSPMDAEVAFVVTDELQGCGIGSILLAHLAAAARAVGINRFLAVVLPENRQMLSVFRAAGFDERTHWDRDGIEIELIIDPAGRLASSP